jgi:hypothetical protein
VLRPEHRLRGVPESVQTRAYILHGGNSTLTWNTVSAVSADLNGTTVPLTGSQVVSSAATSSYRITLMARMARPIRAQSLYL